MRRLLLLLLLLVLVVLSACAPPAPPPVVAPPLPRLTAIGHPQRVVLLSFDGLGADGLAQQSGLVSFAHLASNGAHARVIPVNPTLTGPTHVSMLTGADPQVHGIVSNWFHLPGTPAEKNTRGMDVDIDVETLVEAARRQGKRVGTVLFPSVDSRTQRRAADFGLVWTTSSTLGRVVKLSRADFKKEWVPPTWTQPPQRRTSYSPIMRARIEWSVPEGPRADVDVVAYDTTDDRAENYDAFTVESDDRELTTDSRGWFAVSKEHFGSWSKFLTATPSLDLTLYWGAISRSNAYPATYRDLLDEQAGFWPGAPDERAAIDAITFVEQLERLGDFLARAQAVTVQRMPFDLLLAYQPIVDEALHKFQGADDAVIHRAYLSADRALATVGSLLDGNRDAFIVVGDHGLVPVEHEYHLGRFLIEHGLAPRWRAYTSNNLAHLYRYGPPDDGDAVAALLTATGIFEKVEKKTAASHRNSGDIMATSYPPISVSASEQEPLLGPPASHGHHGALNTHRELQPVFLASGFGVPSGDLGEIRQTKIARFVAELLGIEPPRSAE
ncbi:MAG: alkaline phosphatase family protein [Acidobacteriota bacterium]